jgi:hypothetical protein
MEKSTDIWVRRCRSFEEEAEADREFWARLSPEERVGAVEQMRLEGGDDSDEDESGLRRTVRIVRRT